MTDIRASQTVVLAAGAFPADGTESSQAGVMAAVEVGMDIQITQAVILIAARGRVSDPKVRAWTFTIDGHDFYVLRLGNVETLVLDLYTGQWYVWGSDAADLWRAYTGCNWPGGRRMAGNYTNVLVGDDGNGSLYFLEPGGEADDDALVDEIKRPFTRVVTAQHILPAGYGSVPCFGVQVHGSAGQTTENEDVELLYSDDRGLSFESADTVTVEALDYDARLNWTSLGSMDAPGRLFKITDTGALLRIDHIEMDDPNG